MWSSHSPAREPPPRSRLPCLDLNCKRSEKFAHRCCHHGAVAVPAGGAAGPAPAMTTACVQAICIASAADVDHGRIFLPQKHEQF